MNKKYFVSLFVVIVILVVGLFVILDNNENQDDSKATEDLIIETFEGYRDAVIDSDGQEAVSYLDSQTISYYTDLLNLTINGTKEQVQERNLADQLNILMPRHLIDRSTILSFEDGSDSIVFSVNEGIIGDQSIKGTSIDNVSVTGNTAVADISKGAVTAEAGMDFIFERDEWRINLISPITLANEEFEFIRIQQGLDDEGVLFLLLELVSDARPTESIWTPLR